MLCRDVLTGAEVGKHGCLNKQWCTSASTGAQHEHRSKSHLAAASGHEDKDVVAGHAGIDGLRVVW